MNPRTYAAIDPKGVLARDILGTWVGCIPAPDGAAPYCDFKSDGRLVLLGRKRHRRVATGIYPSSIEFVPSPHTMAPVSCTGPAFDRRDR